MEKEKYAALEMETVVFDTEDVIRTSSPGGNQQGNDVYDP